MKFLTAATVSLGLALGVAPAFAADDPSKDAMVKAPPKTDSMTKDEIRDDKMSK